LCICLCHVDHLIHLFTPFAYTRNCGR
jgi:hypothetical protein